MNVIKLYHFLHKNFAHNLLDFFFSRAHIFIRIICVVLCNNILTAAGV